MNSLTKIYKALVRNLKLSRKPDFSEMLASLGPNDELLWLDSHCPDSEFIGAIRPAIERGAKTKLLILDQQTAGQDIDTLIRRVSSIRCSLRNFGMKEESCQILAHEDRPYTRLFIVTHNGVPVRGFCRTAANGKALEKMHEYFQQKWERNLQRTTRCFHQPITCS